MELQQLAGICHEANKALCKALGDTSQERWEKASKEQRASVIAGVEAHLEDPSLTPEASHQRWCAYKEAEDWVYGEGKDAEAKTHPNLVHYDQLPPEQAAKDAVFKSIVGVLAEFVDPFDVEDDSPPDETENAGGTE